MEDLTLSPFQTALVQSVFDRPVQILRTRWLQALHPCPILVETSADPVILRIARNDGGVERESAIYPALRRIGLPVPRVLAGPVRDADAPELFAMSVVGRLPGQPLSRLAEESDQGLARAAQLLAGAYRQIRAITEIAANSPEFANLPRRTATDDLEEVIRRGGEWLALTEIQDAVVHLSKQIERNPLPLMFTNGDFAPSNFLTDGHNLSGMLDFEKAAFVDPLTVLTRFPVYDLRPLSQSNFIEAVLKQEGYTRADFASRVAIFAIRTLQTKCRIQGGAPHRINLRRHVLDVLKDALANLD